MKENCSTGTNWDGKEYDGECKLEFEGFFSNRKKKRGKEYDYNGKFIEEVEYLSEKGDKKVKEYYYDGKLKFYGKYLNYKMWDGIGYNQNGEKAFEIKEGKGKGKEYDYNGELIFHGNI